MTDADKAVEESAKAVQKIAKTTGKAVEDRLRYMRWERQIRLMKRAEEFMREIGLSGLTRALPLKFAVQYRDLGAEESFSITSIQRC